MKLVNRILMATLFIACFANSVEQLGISQGVDAIKPKKLSSVLVMQDGKLLFEGYYNGAKADDLHNIRSASKTFTGLMFGVAIADGHFSSSLDKVLAAFPGYKTLLYPSEKKTNMTFFDLLSMTNPLECDDMNNFSMGHEERMYLQYDWVGFFLNLPARGNPPWESKMHEQPYGRDFSYCTAGISITAAAIEQKSGQRLSDYTQTALFDALGIKDVNWPYAETGLTQGGGGVEIKPRDLIKIGQLVLQGGNWQGQQLIPKQWITDSLKPYSLAMEELNATYGITWWRFVYPVADSEVEVFAAAGNGGNYLWVVPELNGTAVITATAYSTPYMHQQSQQIFSKVILPALAR